MLNVEYREQGEDMSYLSWIISPKSSQKKTCLLHWATYKKTTTQIQLTLLSKQIPPRATSVLTWLIRLLCETSAVNQILYVIEHQAKLR